MAEPIRLADYEPYSHEVETVALEFDLADGETIVNSELVLRRRGVTADLRLDGVDLALQMVQIDGRTLAGNEYRLDDETLTIFDLPEACTVSIRTRIDPEQNTALEGLYKSGSMYCTQCEAEGFRKITFYPDRPDVLSRFTTSIIADPSRYPVALSNGNLIQDEELEDGRRKVTWEDPFPKPSYLFALVAGDLALMTDGFVTASGREVELRIYSEPHNIGKCDYAMEALKRAMRWDEEVFGREYDLDVFMIVAVEDFNMGAMENKGLNIFNTSCVLATPDTATDQAHQRVEAVVGHEYFHNWSGNRVTCRDWFQLSLKEGFTVFRDAEFSSDMNSRTIKRIEDVEFLRTVQFAEDAGPLAHPIRPDAYVEINNFYTTTIYEKGAEVVRMINTLLGAEAFRRGSDLYFERHDGEAVTTEHFVAAMEQASGLNLDQFRRWYTQSGTPRLDVREHRRDGGLALEISQSCPATPGQAEKQPFHVPVALGLVTADGADALGASGRRNGHDVAVRSDAQIENPNGDGTLVVHLTEQTTVVDLDSVPPGAEVSFLRGFSAPVKVDYPREPAQLEALARRDTDGFARWDAAQTFLSNALLRLVKGDRSVVDGVLGFYQRLLESAEAAADDGEGKAVLTAMMTLPNAAYLLDLENGLDILAVDASRQALAMEIGRAFTDRWRALVEVGRKDAVYRPTGPDIARRGLANLALGYLVEGGADDAAGLLLSVLEEADNLTDRIAALSLLVNHQVVDDGRRGELLESFRANWCDDALVADLWMSRQASSRLPGAIARAEALEAHAMFDRKNPNKVRALYGGFAAGLTGFHAADGSGYAWLADRIAALDKLNPQVAARLAAPLTRYGRFDAQRQQLMKAELGRLAAGSLSNDLGEVVAKSLA